ncbi:hypothetical protein [Hubei tetragnatha maxillosa virus 3]|uniref:hypothetical protein n=1 Tax=Hubei tetragnatha maxillosa virus 3 TaxID=1923245 RepID=UPI00090B64E2|nr:hypothetical protein [Hubei tetragnatha maxillosa virus 3]APG77448.1 hypothetical protein [Hubei tetragnatha maxillosa virus 3]
MATTQGSSTCASSFFSESSFETDDFHSTGSPVLDTAHVTKSYCHNCNFTAERVREVSHLTAAEKVDFMYNWIRHVNSCHGFDEDEVDCYSEEESIEYESDEEVNRLGVWQDDLFQEEQESEYDHELYPSEPEESEVGDVTEDFYRMTTAEPEFLMVDGDRRITVKLVGVKSERIYPLPLSAEDIFEVFDEYLQTSPFFTQKLQTVRSILGNRKFARRVTRYLKQSRMTEGTAKFWTDWTFDTRRHRDDFVKHLDKKIAKAEMAMQQDEVQVEENTMFSDQRETVQEDGFIANQQQVSGQEVSMQEQQWHVRNIMQKPMLVGVIPWSTKDEVEKLLKAYQVPGDTIVGPHYNQIATFAFWRGHPTFRIQLNGTKFHCGRVIVAFIPFYSKKKHTDVLWSTNNLTSFPHVMLDASISNSGILNIPFAHYQTYFGSVIPSAYSFLGQLVVSVFNRLSTSTTSSQTLDISVWVSYDNCELHQPCHAHVPQFAQAESGVEGAVKSVLPMITDLVAPGASSVIGSVAGGIANLDKPTDPVEISRWVPNAVSSLNFGDGLDKSNRLSLRPGTATVTEVENISTTKDDMNLLELAKIPTVVSRVVWGTADAPQALLRTLKVNPCLWTAHGNGEGADPPVDVYTVNLLAYLSRPMKYWRGSIKYRIQIIASAMHSGRLQISFTPGYLASDFNNSNYANTFIVDLQEKSEVEFVVPYMATRPWLRCDKIQEITTTNAGSVIGSTAVGFIKIHVLNRLCCPDTVAQHVDINIFNSAGDDFELAFPSDLAFFRGIGNLVVQKNEAKAESGQEFVNTRTDTQAPQTITAGKGLLSSSVVTTLSENAMDLKTVLRRYQAVFTDSGVKIGTGVRKFLHAFQNTPTLSGVHKKYGVTAVQTRTHLCHYSELFTFWRGSLRYKYVYHTKNPITFTVFHIPGVFGPDKFDPQVVSGDFSDLLVALTSTGAQIAVSQIQNSIEFEIPFYAPYQQLKTMDGGIMNATAATGTVFIIGETTEQPELHYTLFQAAGDDFGLNYLRGAPRVQILKGKEIARDMSDAATSLYVGMKPTFAEKKSDSEKEESEERAPAKAEMFSGFRNPFTQTMNTAAAVERACNTSTNLLNSLSSQLGLAARAGTSDILEGEEDGTDDDDDNGGIVHQLLSALGSFATELLKNAGMKIKNLAVTIANLVSGFNSFLQASSFVVKVCAIVTVVSELFGSVMTTAKDKLFWLVSKFLNGRTEGNQRLVAESSAAIFSFAPVVMATAAVGLLMGGFAKLPNDKETNDVMKLVTERMRTFNFGCAAMSNLKSCYTQMKELFDWIQDTCLNWLAPQFLASMKLQREFHDVETWTKFIDETMATDYVDRSNWDTEFRSRIGRASEAAERYNQYLITGRIGKEASIIREYVRKCYEMRDLVNESHKALPSRKDPFCVCIVGPPGVGKSGSVLYLADKVMDDQNYPKQKRICPVNPIAKQFSEGYAGHAAIYMDDISAFTSEEQYHHFFNLKANTKYALDKPFDKTDYFRSDFIFMTSNIPYPTPNFINDLDAFNRRRDVLIEMTFKDEETEQAAKDGVPGTLKRDYSHAVFRFLNPRDETAEKGPPLTWEQMEEEVKNRARLHYINQEKQLRYLLSAAGYTAPPLISELPPDDMSKEDQLAWFQRVFHPVEEPIVPEAGDDGSGWWIKHHSEVEFDEEKVSQHPLLSLYRPELFSYLQWSGSEFCLSDKGLEQPNIAAEFATLKCDFNRHHGNDWEKAKKDMLITLASVSQFKGVKGALDATKVKLVELKEGLKTYWEKAKKWFEENCPVLGVMRTWPAKLALGLAGVAVLVGFGQRIVHRCLCAVVTHLGYRCPKCGKWPELEKCRWKDWLIREWKEIYGETVDYVAGRVLTAEEEQGIDELRGRSFQGIRAGTEMKLNAEVGPYSDITAGGKQVRIFAHHGPYNNETHGGARQRVFADSGQKTDDLITNRVIPCLYRLRGVHGGVPAEVNGFALGGRLLLIPSHFYDVMDGKFELYYGKEWMVVLKDETRARHIPNKDLVIFTMPVSFHEHKSCVKHLISEKQLGLLSKTECLMMKQMNKDYVMAETVTARTFKELHYELDGEVPTEYFVAGLWEYRSVASPGACGSVLVTMDEKVEGQILGFHCAGNGTYGYSQIVTREMIEPYVTTKLGTPTPECTKQFGRVIPHGHFGRVGQLPKGQGVRQSDKTEIIPTAIQGAVSPPVTQPAILSSRDPRYKGSDNIMTKGIAKYGKPAVPFDPRHIAMVEESFNAEIEQWEVPRKAQVLNMLETLQGIELLDGFDRLPMNTSPGWPYTLTRPRTELGKAYLFDAEKTRIENKELEKKWSARLAMAKLGERVESVWTCCLKDERRPLAKIEAGSTRLFVIPPVDFSLLMRMYTLDFSVAFKVNRHTSFTKVGIDTQSLEWTKLYNYLAECSEYVVAGDFERFDGALPPEMTHQFFKHCNYYYRRHGTCTEEDERVRGVLADESVHTVMLANEDVFVTHVGNKSGNPNTVNINSVANYYYMAISYLGLAERYSPENATMDKFRKNVRIAIYGDDNVLAIKREILEWYNQLTIADFLKGYGIVYTNETKTGLTKYKKLDEASFLKCSFANHESIAKVKVPLMTEATILELLNWTRKAPDQDELLESNINDALRFAYFYGSKYFNALRGKVVAALKERNKTLDVMTYSDFHYWFLFVCGKLPHGKSSAEMNLLEVVAASGNSGFARFMTRFLLGVPCGIASSMGWFVRSSDVKRTDERFAIAIPSGEGKTWLCKKYPHLFVDHDDILLPAAKRSLKEHGMSWTRLWDMLDLELPLHDKRILLVHHPANTRRQMLGSYMLPKPSHIRFNAYQRMRLGDTAKVMERDQRNKEILTLARQKAPYLFRDGRRN